MANFVVAGHRVNGYIYFYAVVVGIFNGNWQLLRGEITGKGAHTKGCAGKIYGICAILDSHFQPFHISGRAEKFHFPHSAYPNSAAHLLCSAKVLEKR